jgi:hypothetical protein
MSASSFLRAFLRAGPELLIVPTGAEQLRLPPSRYAAGAKSLRLAPARVLRPSRAAGIHPVKRPHTNCHRSEQRQCASRRPGSVCHVRRTFALIDREYDPRIRKPGCRAVLHPGSASNASCRSFRRGLPPTVLVNDRLLGRFAGGLVLGHARRLCGHAGGRSGGRKGCAEAVRVGIRRRPLRAGNDAEPWGGRCSCSCRR